MKTIVILISICFTSTAALTCYNCLFWEGHPLSDDCERSPPSIYGCNVNSALTSQPVKGYYQSNDAIFTTGAMLSNSVSKQLDVIPMCMKYTGILDAKSIVARSCGYGSSSLIDVCIRDGAYLTVYDRNATDVLGCFCTGDRCNGASTFRFGYLSLFAITIHIIYKFASAK